MTGVSSKIIELCKDKLIMKKAEILNRMRSDRAEYKGRDKAGDETDMAMSNLAENQFLLSQDRLRTQLLEIEIALSRIERGMFGICEETEEPIETDRLLAIPWTRLSIEGAEIRDDMSKRFAK